MTSVSFARQESSTRLVRQPESVLRVSVSVVVPCFNEFEAIPNLEERLDELIEQGHQEYDFEFLIVDDCSSDRSWELLEKLFHDRPGFRLLQHKTNQGITAAIMTGLSASSHEIVCAIDSDCTYDPAFLLNMLPCLSKEIAVVTASPYHPDGQVANVPGWRIGLSRTASRIYRFLFRNKLDCYTCAFRVYRREAVENIQPKNSGFTGIVELLWLLDQRGETILEIPAKLNVRQFGRSKMRTFKVALGHIKLMSLMLVSGLFTRKTNSQ